MPQWECGPTVDRVESKEYMIHSVPSNLSNDKITSADVTEIRKQEWTTVLKDHPVFLYTRTPQTSAHDVIVGCLITFDSDPLYVLKEARRGERVIKTDWANRLRLTSRTKTVQPPATSMKH